MVGETANGEGNHKVPEVNPDLDGGLDGDGEQPEVNLEQPGIGAEECPEQADEADQEAVEGDLENQETHEASVVMETTEGEAAQESDSGGVEEE